MIKQEYLYQLDNDQLCEQINDLVFELRRRTKNEKVEDDKRTLWLSKDNDLRMAN
jgi:hypothetical protein